MSQILGASLLRDIGAWCTQHNRDASWYCAINLMLTLACSRSQHQFCLCSVRLKQVLKNRPVLTGKAMSTNPNIC